MSFADVLLPIASSPPKSVATTLSGSPARPAIQTRDVRTYWRRLRENRPLRVAIVWSVVAYVVLQLTFVAWVHYSFEGRAHRILLPGAWFGIPDREAAAGMQYVCRLGYDGQQYFWMSNDLLGRFDAYKHLDEPLYRYQRIGFPMLSGGLTALLGLPLTPSPLYLGLQFALASAGFGGLVYWLSANGLQPAYALGWLLSCGTLCSLCGGLIDAPADAFFVFTLLAIFARRLWWYVPLATLLLLTRETYSLFAFAVFVVTAFGALDWKDTSSRWKRAALTALPGIVMLAWTAYLAIHFGASPIAARSNPGMKSWPFYMMWRHLGIFFYRGDWPELRMLVVAWFTLVLVCVVSLGNIRRLPLAITCSLPLLLMVSSTGIAIWECYAGSTRALGAVVILGVFLMSIEKSVLLKLMLLLQVAAGVDTQVERHLMHPRLYSFDLIEEEEGFVGKIGPDQPDNQLCNDLRSSVEWIDPQSVCRREYNGIWNWCHRETKAITLAVSNRSDQTWNPGLGMHPIKVGYILCDHTKKRVLCEHQVVLDESIAPGETKMVPIFLELRQPGKKYWVKFSVHQEGPGWFIQADPDYGGRYEFTVE